VPQSVLSLESIRSLLGVPITESQLDELLFASKAEVEDREGDALTVSVTPDRLDLLSEAGLALHLAGSLEAEIGLPRTLSGPSGLPGARFEVDPSVDPIRPWISGVLLRAPGDGGLDAGTLVEAIRFQEILHATVGRDRRAASIGIYPWERLRGPVLYTLERISEVRFVPLDGTEEIDARRFFEEHPLATRYGPYGRVGDRCLVLRDAAGAVLSLPPILNSRTAGEARAGDRELLLEVTGTRERSVREMLGLLLVVFTTRGWAVSPVEVVGPGSSHDDGRGVFSSHRLDLSAAVLNRAGGVTYSAAEVERRFARSRLSAHPHAGGWAVDIPPWRPDLLAPIDLAEEVLLAVPIRAEDGTSPPSFSRGRRRPETVFRRSVATDLLGLGFAAPHTSLLVSEAAVSRFRAPPPIRMRNPVSMEFAYLRDRLLLSHIEVLAHNTRHGYPQRFAEVGPVVLRSPEAESGGATRHRAGLIIASDTAGFAEVAALVDYLLRRRDVVAVREPVEIPVTIPGRAARARVAGESVAEMGELHPEILTEIGVPVPVAWAELDLTALWPLLARREAH
jgi:phenylalanyl-tRNA synthetase beta chain